MYGMYMMYPILWQIRAFGHPSPGFWVMDVGDDPNNDSKMQPFNKYELSRFQ